MGRSVPLYTADALVLRTYALGEADRLVVFLTRDRGKKRGVAKSARRPRSRFMGALEPLTEARVAYFESARRELVGLNYAETIRSPLGLTSGTGSRREVSIGGAGRVDARGLLRRAAERVGAGRRRRRAAVSAGGVDARRAGRGRAGRAAGALLRVLAAAAAGPLPGRDGVAVGGARAFLAAARTVAPHDVGTVAVDARAIRELERVHRALITMHLEKTLKSDRVLRDLRRHA